MWMVFKIVLLLAVLVVKVFSAVIFLGALHVYREAVRLKVSEKGQAHFAKHVVQWFLAVIGCFVGLIAVIAWMVD